MNHRALSLFREVLKRAIQRLESTSGILCGIGCSGIVEYSSRLLEIVNLVLENENYKFDSMMLNSEVIAIFQLFICLSINTNSEFKVFHVTAVSNFERFHIRETKLI